jgi:hypothetical protein
MQGQGYSFISPVQVTHHPFYYPHLELSLKLSEDSTRSNPPLDSAQARRIFCGAFWSECRMPAIDPPTPRIRQNQAIDRDQEPLTTPETTGEVSRSSVEVARREVQKRRVVFNQSGLGVD